MTEKIQALQNKILDENRLPELLGNVSLENNPVDTYLAGKSQHTQRMVKSHMNKVSKLFGYKNYQSTPYCNHWRVVYMWNAKE